MAAERRPGDEVRLSVLGEHGSIDIEALHTALGALLDLFKAGGLAGGMVISDLREGSAQVAVRARYSTPETELRFAEIVKGLNDLAEEQVAEGWDSAMLESALGLASVLEFTGVAGVQVSANGTASAVVTPTTRTTAQRELATSSVSIGSVTGRIHRFFDHKSRREFGLIDELTQHSVKVTFSRDMETKVLRAVGKTVLAWGELRRNRDGRKVHLKLDDLRIVGRGRPAPDLDEMVGLLGPDWTGGESSVESVRRQRDGE
jgi:hypothetical protein